MAGEKDPQTGEGANGGATARKNLGPQQISLQPGPDASSADAEPGAKRERFIAVLATMRQKELDEAQQKMLKDLSCKRDQNGALTVYRDGSDRPVMSIDPSGHSATSYYDPSQPDDAKEHVDGILQASAALKANDNGKPVQVEGHNELSTLMIAKAVELNGMKVANKPEKSLDEVNPALARKMEAEFVAMGGVMPSKAAVYDNKTQVSGLVTTPSPLDSTPKGMLAANFGPAAAGVSPIATPSIAPAAPKRISAPDSALG